MLRRTLGPGRNKVLAKLAFLIAVTIGICCAGIAQTTTATLLGLVRDPSGAAMPGVRITAQNIQTSLTRVTRSDATGAYLISNLPIGNYRLIAEAPGFEKFVQSGITLAVDQNARVDVVLQIGSTSQTVQVTAESTGVDTHSATVGELVDPSRMQELPLNGRNAMTLAEVAPGVTNILSAPTVQTLSRSGPSITIEGGRDTQNEVRFDDVTWKNITQNTLVNLPNPDALQEFEVLTSNFSAEYGRNSGGVIIAATRSGTNEFHGTLWEYLRNTDLDARNFFSSGVPQLIQNQYGFTFGGPAIKNRLFFFGSFQGSRIRQSEVLSSATPPTPAERGGDFSATGKTIKNPATGQVFANGVIPSALFDPVAVKFMNAYMPLANSPNGTWTALVPNPTNDNQYLWRADYDSSDRQIMTVRFFDEGSSQLRQDGNIAPYNPNTYTFRTQSWAAHDTYSFNAQLVNEAWLGVGRMNFVDGETSRAQLSDLGATFPGVLIPELPTVAVSGYYNLADDDLYNERDNIYQLGDTVRRNSGKQSISFGGEIQRLELYNGGSSGNQGNFSFNGSQSGNAFADFLLGRAVSMTQKSPYQRNAKTWNWYTFFQDDVRLTQRLTIDLGLRYEWFRPFEIDGNALHTNTYRAGEQSVITPSAPLGMVFPGDPGIGNGLVPTDTDDFGPRIGIAWDPFGNGRTAIRAGYGLLYEDQRSDIWTYPAVNQPFVITDTINTPSSFQNPYSGFQNPFPYLYSSQTAKFSYPMGLFTVPN
ncbi:MAG: carboxypeptidase regulatory-like domain-containing protein, partial [Terriglobia bacterium]